MDDLERRLKESLRFRLSFWLSLVIVGVAVVAGTVSFVVAFGEANDLQDDILRQTAALFDRHHLPVPGAAEAGDVGDDPDARLVVQRLGSAAGTKRAANTPAFPAGLADGMHAVTLDGRTYRVFVRTLGSGERIAVGQETDFRNETAAGAALRSLLPFVVLIPLLLLVIANIVRKMFAPVLTLAGEVNRRGDRDLRPIPAAPLPREIRPFVVAINRLLERVADSMAMQRRFVAAAAHELRSPLTALSLQAERLEQAEMPEIARERLAALRRGIERNRVLLDQLLTFARAQSPESAPPKPVSVQSVYRAVLEELMPLAEAKRLDVGVETDTDATVLAHEVDLTTVIKNLVGNAIRYTPEGGRIDLSLAIAGDTVTLVVEDSGPGIPESERDRVFEPFHRTLATEIPGSGLGLSIVKSVVERLGGHVSLESATRYPTGLHVAVSLPRRG